MFDEGKTIKEIWQYALSKGDKMAYATMYKHLMEHYKPKKEVYKQITTQRVIDKGITEIQTLLESIHSKLRLTESLIDSAIQSLDKSKPSPQILNSISNLLSKAIELIKLIIQLRKEFELPTETKLKQDFEVFFQVLSEEPEETVVRIMKKLQERLGIGEVMYSEE